MIGHSVDTAAVIGTIFGIATTCGISVVQLNYGLHVLFDLPENLWMQASLIGVAVVMTIIWVTSGVNKGLRILSEVNIYVSVGLMLFILFLGNTEFLLNTFVQNIGDYISRFPSMTLESFAFQQPKEWMNSWTLFFWAWWVAWSPFLGLFLARILRGRTIREFVSGTLIISLIFTLTWLSIFGNSALHNVIFDGNLALARTVIANPAHGFYDLLAQYPYFSSCRHRNHYRVVILCDFSRLRCIGLREFHPHNLPMSTMMHHAGSVYFGLLPLAC